MTIEDIKCQALVVEAADSCSRLFSGLFKSLSFKHISFSSISSALDLNKQYSPRLVVLDQSVSPEKSCQYINKIRSNKDGVYVTIVMINNRISATDLKLVVEAGLDFFWTDEIDNELLSPWLSTVEKGVYDALEREVNDKQIINYKKEQDDFNNQLEDAITRANEMAREAEHAYIEINQIFKTIAGGIVVIDANCKLLRFNDTFLEMAGKSREEALDAKCYEAFHNVLCNSSKCPLQVIKNGESRVENNIEQTLPDGRKVFYHTISTPFRGPVGELIGIVEHITDITAKIEAERALKESEERYKKLSTVDELTGLFNKRYFSQHFKLEIERAQRYENPLSLLLMDIDNFKHHNDTYGHTHGDVVLEELGKILKNAIRVNDIGCRYGGEEFTVILPETRGDAACVVAERIRKRFADLEFMPNSDEIVQKTVSIGVSEFIQGDSVNSLVERTDKNMYKAKESGKNRIIYE